MPALVAARNIRKAFDRIPVLHGIDLDLMPGEIIGLLGENGAGKSTLMNILAGELPADSGELAFDGVPIRLDGTRDRHLGIRFIHQELSIVPSLSVAENIFLGDYCAGPSGFIDRKAMRTRATALLARVGASHIDPRISAGRLRAGEQQLVEVAKALAGDIRLLIMDEPTSSLTDHEAQALFGQMRSLAAAGVAVIFITHRIEEALSICNRILVLRDGRVVSDRPASVGRSGDHHPRHGRPRGDVRVSGQRIRRKRNRALGREHDRRTDASADQLRCPQGRGARPLRPRRLGSHRAA